MSDGDRLLVFTGSSNPELTKEVCTYIGVKEAQITISKFVDGEIHLKSEENTNVYLIWRQAVLLYVIACQNLKSN